MEPLDPSLDLMVTAHSAPEAQHAWERWAEDVKGATGQHILAITHTPPLRQPTHRQKEKTELHDVDLDRLAFFDEYDSLEDLETSPFRI
ncbi:hypothetical protein [Methylobacterium hispanicum]|nr:hypothetical protein [Methylobacterium hispanicum]